jgi:hypothetical protein
MWLSTYRETCGAMSRPVDDGLVKRAIFRFPSALSIVLVVFVFFE